MSDDLISRQAAIEFIKDHSYPVRYDNNSIEQGMTVTGIEQALNEVPTVQLEQKTGRWKEILVHRDDEGDILRDYECTNCLGIICDIPDDVKDQAMIKCLELGFNPFVEEFGIPDIKKGEQENDD